MILGVRNLNANYVSKFLDRARKLQNLHVLRLVFQQRRFVHPTPEGEFICPVFNTFIYLRIERIYSLGTFINIIIHSEPLT